MPVYNGEDYIKDTISYILNSSFKDFELVLVNDGSKDNSYNICKKIAAEDFRVKLIDKTNGGIADARNFGVANAEGEYIAFCDQDDFIELKTILKLLNICREDIVFFSTVKDYGNYREICDNVKISTSYQGEREIFDNCIWPMAYPTANIGNVSYFGHVWQAVYKNSIIKNCSIQFKSFVSIEDDFIFLLEALLHANSVSLNQAVGYRWSVNPKSTTYKKNYIQNMRDKCEAYYAFTKEILSSSPYFDEICLDKYVQMSKQVLGVRLIINEGNSASFWGPIKMIRNYINENKKYFNGAYLGQGASRKSAKYIYWLLKHRMIISAYIFQKCINLKKSLA